MFKCAISSKRVTIQASQEKVWGILFDISSYSQWNPFTHRVESSLKLGDKIDLYVRMPVRGDRMQTETVCCMDKPRQMAWSMKLMSSKLLAARRDQMIEKVDDSSCTYETMDVFEGLLAPLVMRLFKQDVEGGFNNMAQALKVRAEKTA